MASIDKLQSIREKGLIGDEKVKVFFSEGFEGAIALFVDFQMVYDGIYLGLW